RQQLVLYNHLTITFRNAFESFKILSFSIHLGSPKESAIIPSKEFSSNQLENSFMFKPLFWLLIRSFKLWFLKSFQDISAHVLILLKKVGAKVNACLPFKAAS